MAAGALVGIWCGYGQLCTGGFLCIWHLAFLACKLPNIVRQAAQMVASVARLCCRLHVEDKENRLVRRHLQEIHVKMAEPKLQVVSHLAFGVLLLEYVADQSSCPERTFKLLSMSPLIILARIRPLATPCCLHVVHFYWIVLIFFYELWVPINRDLQYVFLDSIRLTAALVGCNFQVTFVAEFVYFASTAPLVYRQTHPYTTWFLLRLSSRLISTAGVIFLAAVIDWLLLKFARLMLDSKVTAQNEAVIERLLTGMCDAVVRLRSNFTIERHSPQLAALLLHAPSKSLEGVPFQDLLQEDDRTAFCKKLADSTKASTASENSDAITHANMSCSLPGNMRDSSGNRVPVQLVYTSVQDVNDEFVHVIGIREDSVEEQLAPMPVRNRSTFSRAVNSASSSSWAASDASDSASNAGSVGGVALSVQPEVASEVSSAFSGAFDLSCDAVVWVNVRTDKLKVTRSSSGFHSLCGPSDHCTQLLPLVARHQRVSFKEWLMSVVEAQMQGRSHEAQFNGLILQPRHLKRHRISAQGNAVMKREMDAPGEGTPAENIWLLELSNIEWIQGRIGTAAATPMQTNSRELRSATASGSRGGGGDGHTGYLETTEV
mmetsp:Transcript_112880/g.218759  ORF Transcript_112880/g.218759 Transcript_112880/m.218759 type:complete len:604 (+) Transcript_112880:43-1854(+)